MTNKKFDAILAKNDIARELKSLDPNFGFIEKCLYDIEKYIGEGNQPSVKDIMECKEFEL